MPADEQGDEDLLEHVLLADDDFVHLGQNAVAHRLKACDAFFEFRRVESGFNSRHCHR